MSKLFDPRFRKALGEILRRAPRLRGGRHEATRARRRVQSESGTFSGHRAYSEGEDIRNLDWNVYARTEELFLKVLEEDDRIGLTLVLDCSGSMRAGDRWSAAARLAAVLGGLALVQFDGLRLVWGPGLESVFEGASSLGRFLEQIESVAPTARARNESTAQAIVSSLLQQPVANLAWISDFAVPREFQVALAMLRKTGCRSRGWLPTDATDRLPEVGGFVRLQDPETGAEEVLQVDQALRSAMAAELRVLARQQDGVFGTVGYPLVRFPIPAPGDYRIASWTDNGAVYVA